MTPVKDNNKATQTHRSLFRFLLFPRKQLKYAYFHFLIVCMSVLIINVAAYFKFASLATVATNSLAMDLISEFIVSQSKVTLFTLAVMGLFTFLIVIVFLHRFVGPMLPLLRHLEAIMDGNYSYRTKLRDGDEISELAHKLNEVSEMLENKKAG